MNDFWYFMIAGGLILLVPIFVIAYFQAGFFLNWLIVKTSRGKKVLIKVRGKLIDSFKTGVIDGDFLIYGKKEERRRLVLDDEAPYRSFGINVVDIDGSKQAVMKRDYKAVSGHDGERFESLYIRALFRPSLTEDRQKLLIILLIVVLCALGISLFFSWNISQQIAALSNVGTVKPLI